MAKEKKEDKTPIVLNAVALGMGVCSVVLAGLGTGPEVTIILLGIGVSALGLLGLDKLD